MASSSLLRPLAPLAVSSPVLKSAHTPASQEGRLSVAMPARSFKSTGGAGRSSFLGGAMPIRSSQKKAVKAERRPLSVEANVFKRAKRMVQSYTNAVKSSIEDPARLLDDSLRDLDKERQKVRETLKQVQFSITQLQGRGRQAAVRAQEWHDRAKSALEKGHEDLAREALRNQKEYEASGASLQSQWKQQTALLSKLESSAGLLEEKIEEARAKRTALVARAQTASANRRVQEILGGLSTGGAVAKFEEVKEKVSKLEAEAEALAEVTGESLEARFRDLERSNMDRELTQLRAEVGTNPSKNEVAVKDRVSLPDFLNLKRQSDEKRSKALDVEVIDADELERRFNRPPVLASAKTENDVSRRSEDKPWWAGREAGRDWWDDETQPSAPESGGWPSWGDVSRDVSGRREGDLVPAFPWQRVAALAMQLAFGFLVFGVGMGGRPGNNTYGPGLPGGMVLGGPFMGPGRVIVRRVSPFGSPFGGSPFDPLGQMMRPYGGRMMPRRGGVVYRRIIIN